MRYNNNIIGKASAKGLSRLANSAYIERIIPIINSVSPANYNGEDATVFTILGTNFDQGTIVDFLDSSGNAYRASTTSIISSTQITAITPQPFLSADGPLDVKVTISTGETYVSPEIIQTGGLPAWNTPSGQLGPGLNKDKQNATIQLQATDPEGEFVSYSIRSGALPTNLILDKSNGLISGDIDVSISADTNYSLVVGAIDTSGNITNRSFFINVLNSVASISYTWQFAWSTPTTGLVAFDYGRAPKNFIEPSESARIITPDNILAGQSLPGTTNIQTLLQSLPSSGNITLYVTRPSQSSIATINTSYISKTDKGSFWRISGALRDALTVGSPMGGNGYFQLALGGQVTYMTIKYSPDVGWL